MDLSKGKKITKRQIRADRFPHEYIIDLNGKKAAIRCGYSPKTAESQASRLLRKDKVANKIKELQDAANRRAIKTADDWDREIDLVAFFRGHHDFYQEDGSLKPIKDLTAEQLTIVQEIEHASTGGGDKPLIKITNLKIYDKMKALEMKGKRLGIYRDGSDRLADSFEKWLDTIHAERGK
jgi:phage terminase small subunit